MIALAGWLDELNSDTQEDDVDERMLRDRAIDLIRDHGLLVDDAKQDGFAGAWDGKTFFTAGLDSEQIVHELAHFLVAPRSRQRLPNFGLGPDFAHYRGTMRVSEWWADIEEARAAMLGILLYQQIGGSTQYALTQNGMVGGQRMAWFYSRRRIAYRALRWLINHRLVDGVWRRPKMPYVPNPVAA